MLRRENTDKIFLPTSLPFLDLRRNDRVPFFRKLSLFSSGKFLLHWISWVEKKTQAAKLFESEETLSINDRLKNIQEGFYYEDYY
jgi:hypothetical protein